MHIAFDAFGTLCYIAERTHPFRELLRQSVLPPEEARRLAMTRTLDLSEWGRLVAPSGKFDLAAIEAKLQTEVASVRLYPETLEALGELQRRGIKCCLVSNLASPYAAPVRQLLGDHIDEYIWSFEVGAIKPEPAIFQALMERLGWRPEQVLMVGDSETADVQGAQSFGMSALHLKRGEKSLVGTTISSLLDVLVGFDARSAGNVRLNVANERKT